MGILEIIKIVFGFALMLFIPGFAITLALWPKTNKKGHPKNKFNIESPNKDTIDPIERIALSFGLSIAIVPLIGITLDKTPYGIRASSLLFSLLVVTLLFLGVFYYRKKNERRKTEN